MWWYLKQLLPLAYRSTYLCDGKLCRSTWRMWLGRCFNVRTDCTPLAYLNCRTATGGAS